MPRRQIRVVQKHLQRSLKPETMLSECTPELSKTGSISIQTIEANADATEEFKSTGCGCGRFKPHCLEKLDNAKCLLVCLSLSSFVQGALVNGLVNVVITTIEKRYHLSSSETGLIASSYDIASLICILPVSYFGGAGHRNRWLSIGMVTLGAGGILFSIPHFISGVYDSSGSSTNVCSIGNLTTSSIMTNCSSPLSRFRYFFIFSQLLHGVGASPLYTLGISFLDDSVKPKLSSVYVGIFYAFSVLGPAFGFLVGGQLLKIYIDFDRTNSWSVSEASPAWLGNWWIGFLVTGVCAILISIPLFMFPVSLPHSQEYKAQRVVETHSDVVDTDASRPGFGGSIHDLPKALKYLLMNLTFLFLSLAAAADGFLVSGLTAYGPKIFQSQFGYSASNAALIMGAATIPMGAGGTLLGGYFVKRLHLTCAGIIKFCLTCSFIAFCCIFCFLIKCPDVQVAGVNALLHSNLDVSTMTGSCNSHCACPADRYDPVCALDTNTIFLTPCLAGCIGNSSEYPEQEFYSCSCVATLSNRSLPVARRGSCTNDCSNLHYVFITVFALGILFTFLSSIPGVSATLRCVSDSQRPFAMGVQWVIVRALGSVPGPLCFGVIIDTVCIYWQAEPCGEGRGRCLSYGNRGLSNAMFAISVITKGLTMLCFFLAWWCYKPPPKNPRNEDMGPRNPHFN